MPDFYEIWHSEQIEHANYELMTLTTQNYKFAKFGAKLKCA